MPRRTILGALVAYAFAGSTLANPVGPAVVNGTASFATAGKSLTVTNTPNAIINWKAFSIGAGETTRFVQQSATSAVLNRVVGQDPSAILGTLSSNGRVFLLNPNGIVFGAGSQVNVAGLVASTLNLSNQDFLAGRLNFEAGATANSVVNYGNIVTPSGGRVYLIAPNVENHGVISTPQGQTILAAGKSVQLVEADVPNLRVEVTAGGEALNVGQIIAEGGAAGIYAGLISQKGTVRADSVSRDAAGNIVFRASRRTTLEAGSVTSANGGTGGRIEITGTEVGLLGNAKVEAKGEKGGGTVLVGGDYQGKNPDVPNARATYVGPDALIDASATESGDGGKVVVWADDVTRYYGTILARGGAAGGNGGTVEVSGKRSLGFAGSVDTSAPNGVAGKLLLDPDDIFIVVGPGPSQPNAADGLWAFGEDPGSQSIGADVVVSLLNSNDLTLQATNNIDVASSAVVNYTAAFDRTLTLQANNSIIVNSNAQIKSTGANKLNVVLNSDRDGNSAGAISIGSGAIINSNGGNVTVGGGLNPLTTAATSTSTVQFSGGVELDGATINSGAGNISIRGQGSSSGTHDARGVSLVNGSVLQASGAGAITIVGTGGNTGATGSLFDVGVHTNGTQITSVDGQISITGTGGTSAGQFHYGNHIYGGLIQTTGTGNIVLTGTGGTSTRVNEGLVLRLGAVVQTTGSGNIGLIGNGGSANNDFNLGVDIFDAGTLINSAGSGTLTITGNGSAGTTGNHGVSINNSATVSSVSGAINITGTGAGSGSSNYGVLLEVGGKVQSTGAAPINITGTGATGSFGIQTSGTPNLIGNSVQANTTGNVTLTALGGTGISLNDSITTSGNITLTATGGGNIVSNGVLTSGGNILLDASTNGSNITVSKNVVGTGAASNSLTVRAGNTIVFDTSADVSTTNAFNVVLNSDRDGGGAGAISLGSGTVISSIGGNITLGGGADPTSNPAHGTGSYIEGAKLSNATLNAGTGSIEIRGAGYTSGGNNNIGVLINGGSQIIAGGGITIEGTGGGAGTFNHGVSIRDPATLIATTGAGGISITGHRGSGGNNNVGIVVGEATIRSTATGTGDIQLTATGGAAGGTSNEGIEINSGAVIESLNTSGGSKITLDGTAGTYAGATLTIGALVAGGATIATQSGDISITGASAGTGSSNYGVAILGSSITSAGVGDIAITGTGSATGTDQSHGVRIYASGLVKTSGAGGITVTGNRGSGSDSNVGIQIDSGGVVQSTSSGTGLIHLIAGAGAGVTGLGNAGIVVAAGSVESLNASGGSQIHLDGTGGNGTSDNIGVQVVNGTVSSASGAILIQGAGAGSTTNNHGFAIQGTGVVESTGSAPITITGTGASGAADVNMSASANRIGKSTSTGSIVVEGVTAGGLVFSGGTVVTQGNVTLTSDNMALNGGAGSISGDTITVRPNSLTRPVEIANSPSGSALGLTPTELQAFSAGSKLLIGRSDATGGTFTLVNALSSTDIAAPTLEFVHRDIQLNGSIDFSAGNENLILTAIAAGAVNLNNGVNVNVGTGSINASAGSGFVTFNGTGAGSSTITASSFNAGSLTLDAGDSVTLNAATAVGDLNINGNSTLAGSGSVAVNNNLAWLRGTVSGTGTLTVTNTATLDDAAGGQTLDGKTLVIANGATATMNDVGLYVWGLGLQNGGSVQNDGTLIMKETAIFANSSPGTIASSGTFTANPGASKTAQISGVDFTQTGGSVGVSTGNLQFLGSQNTTMTGSAAVTVASGAALLADAGANGAGTAQFNLGPSASVGGAGQFKVLGNFHKVTLDGSYGVTGKTTINTGGTAFVKFNQATTLTDLDLLAGDLSGSADVTVNGTFNWSGGAITKTSGTPVFRTTGTSNLAGGSLFIGNGGAWENSGSVNFSSGDIRFYGTSSSIKNTSTGIFSIFTGYFDGALPSITYVGGTGHTIINDGVLGQSYSAGSGLNRIATNGANLSFQNSATGLIEVSGGTLQLDGGFAGNSNAGTINLYPGKVLSTNNNGFTNAATGVLAGTGSINVGTGTLTNNGTIRPGLWFGTTTGTLGVTGNFTMGSTGVLEMEASGTSTYDVLAVSGNVALGGNGTVTLTEINAFSASAGNTFDVVTAGGTLTGIFGTATSPSMTLTQANLAGPNRLQLGIGSLTNYWNTDSSGLWSVGSNWSRGHVPTSSEDAVIGRAGFDPTVTVSSGSQAANSVVVNTNDNLTISGGSLDLTAASSVGGGSTLTLSGGTLTALGSLDVNGNLNWTGGNATGVGALNTFGTTTVSSSGGTLDTKTWNNSGTVNLNSSFITMNSASAFNNQSGGIVNLNGPGTFNGGGAGPNTVSNNLGGVINKTASASSTLNIAINSINSFDNAGTVNVDAGTLVLGVGGTDTGTYAIGANTLQSNASRSFNSGISFTGSGGSVVFSSGTQTFGAAHTFLSGGPALTLTSGTLSSASALNMQNAFNWTGGNATGAGALNTSGTTTVSSSGGTLDTKTWNNSGTVNLNSSFITMNSASAFNNQSGGIVNLNGPGAFNGGGAGPNTVSNNLGGVINKTASASSTLNIAINSINSFDNAGTVNVDAGTLVLGVGGTDTGTYAIGANTLQSNASRSFNSGISFTGSGGSVVFSSGTQTFGAAHTFLSGGPALTLTSGTLSSASALNMQNAFNWTGGNATGTGALNTSGTTTVSSSGGTLDTKTWNNSGTVDLNSSFITMNSASAFNNLSGGIVNLNGPGAFNGGGAGPNTVSNNLGGVINKTASASSTLNIAINSINSFDNAGTVNVDAGTLVLGVPSTQSGTVNLPAGTTLSTASQNLINSGTINGSGTINLGGATLTNNGTISPGGAAAVGTLTITGNYAQGAGGSLDVDLQSGVSYDVLAVSGTATLAGALNRNYLSAYTPANGSTHTVLTYASRSGTFTSGTDASSLTLVYGATGLDLIKLAGTANVWTPAGGGDWNTAGNWSLTHVPDSTETALIADLSGTQTITLASGAPTAGAFTFLGNETFQLNGGGSLTVNGTSSMGTGGTLHVNGGTLTMIGALATPNLTMSSGTLQGAGIVTASGAFNWSGGTMSGGTKVAGVGSNLTISNSVTLDGGSFTNNSANGLWTGNGTITLHNGSVFTNSAGAVLEAQGDGTLTHAFNGQTFNNAGTFRKATGTGTTTIGGTGGLTFNNTGTLDIQSGAVDMSGVFNNVGSTYLAANRTLTLSSTASGSGGGIYNLGSGALVDLTAGTQTFTAGADITGAGLFRINGSGTMTVNTTMSADRIALGSPSATLNGSGALTIDNSFGWSGGTMSGATKTVAPTASLTISGPVTLDGGSFTNNSANGLWTGNGTITLHNNSIFTNSAGAVLEAQGDGTLTHAFNGQTFDNAGTFRKTAGTGTTAIGGTGGLTFNNTGTLDIQSGSVSMSGILNNNGNVNLAAGRTLTFTQPVSGFGGGSYTIGPGALVDLTTGTQTFTSGADIAGAGLFRVSGGTMTVNAPTMNADNIAFTSGTINGSGVLTLDNSFAWSGGTMSGGMKVAATGSNLAISGSVLIDSGGFTNNTVNGLWTGNGTITLHNSSIFTNSAGAVLEAQGDGALTHAFNGQLFTNAGIFKKTTGTGTTTIGGTGGLTFNNTGTLDIQSGTVDMTGAFTQSGVVDIAAGATLLRSGGFTSTGTIRGAGTLYLAGGTLTNNGIVAPGGAGTVGTLTVDGDYSQGAGGSLNIDLQSGVSFDVLAVSGTAALNGTLNVNYLGGYTGAGNSHAAMTYGSRTGTFSTINDIHTLSPTYGATASTLGVAAGGPLFWDSGGDGVNWSDPLNWSTNALPTTADDVLLDTGAAGGPALTTINVTTGSQAAKSLNSYEHLTISGGSLGLTNASTMQTGTTLTLSGGTLTASGGLTAHDLVFSSGTLAAGGATVSAANSLALSGSANKVFSQVTFVNQLAGTWTGTGNLLLDNTSTFSNTGSLNVQNDAQIFTGTGNATFNNSGSFTKSAGTGTTVIGGNFFNNAGTVNANSGTIAAQVGGTHTGTFTAASGATMAFTGAMDTFNAGGISGAAGSTISIAGATVNINPGATYSAATTNISSGTLNLGAGGASTASYVQSGGSVSGAGGFTVTSAYNRTGGTISLSGPLSITQSVGDLIVNNPVTGNGVSLVATAGSVLVSNSSIFGSGGGLTFSAGGPTGDVVLTNVLGNAAGPVNVSGRDLTLIASTGSATMLGATMNVNMTRNISLTGGAAGGAALTTIGGAQTIAAGNNIALTAGGSGTVGDAGFYGNNGLQTITAGNVLALAGGAGGDGNSTYIQGGQGQVISAGSIQLTGGNSAGPNGNGVEISQLGAGSSQTINVTGGGTLSLQGGTGNLNHAEILNSGTSQTINFLGGGTLSLTGGSGGYGNRARIVANSGTQTIQGSAGISNAPIVVLQGGGAGGIADLGNEAAIEGGLATQNIYAASLTLAGGSGLESLAVIGGGGAQTLTVSGLTQLTGGSGTDAAAAIVADGAVGNITLNSTGGVSLQGGTGATSSFGAFALIGNPGGNTDNVSVNGGGNISLAKGASGGMGRAFIGSGSGAGTVQLNASALNLGNGEVKTTGGLTLTSGSPTTIGSGGFVGAGNLVTNNALSVQGLLSLGSGTTNLGFGGTHTGTFSIAPGATLNFSGGAHNLNAGSNFAGAGAVGLTAGSLNLATPVSVSTFNMGGGTLAGAGILTVNSALNYTGGNINGTMDLGGASNSFLNGVSVAGTGQIDNLGALTLQNASISPSLINDGALTVLAGVNTVASIDNNGLVLVNAGTLNAPGFYTQFGGLTHVFAGAMLNVPGGLVLNGGSLMGNGVITGNVNNVSGTLAAGASVGTLTVNGNYTQGPGGTMQVEFSGSSSGQYDVLNVTGAASIDGTLALVSLPGAIIVPGSPMGFLSAGSLSGTFATTLQPPLGSFSLAYTPTGVDLSGTLITTAPAVPPPPSQVLPQTQTQSNSLPASDQDADPQSGTTLDSSTGSSGSTAPADDTSARKKRVPTCG